jgi:hypothetical protein
LKLSKILPYEEQLVIAHLYTNWIICVCGVE